MNTNLQALTGNETTQVILDKALIDKIDKTAPLFQEEINKRREEKKKKLLSLLEQTLRTIPFKGEEAKIKKDSKTYVNEYLSLLIRERYPLVLKDIYELKRKVKFDYNDKEVTLDLPVFACVTLGKSTQWEECYGCKIGYNTLEVTVSAKMPHLSDSVKEAGREAIAYCYEMYSKAMKTPIVGELLFTNVIEYNPGTPKLDVVWKPRRSDFNIEIETIEDPDPILLLNWGSKLYKVVTWEDKHEEDFQTLLDYLMDSSSF
ncbi:hypothetical protein DRJ17_02780 [Candidatus Woesearchaeota archaeon]|nr:MAG: hypothetical protein DRJ17_02780 [Candidatus Woesearchaeota archaeon]